MVLKFGRFSFVVRPSVSLSRQQERRVMLDYQKKYLSSMVPFQEQKFFRDKIDKFIGWYDEVTGMDEVRLAQRRVLEDEEQFRKAQEYRRDSLNELSEIQQKLKDLYAELENTPRGDDRFVVLVTQEHKLLKEEKQILEKFSRAEKLERETFAALSSSVKLSHEKERAQSERTKYWSIIGSALGTVLGILGSSVNNHFKMKELKQIIKNSTNPQLLDSIHEYQDTNKKILEKIKKNSSVPPIDKEVFVKIEGMLGNINKRLNKLEESVKKVEENTEKRPVIESASEEGVVVTVPAKSVEECLRKDYEQLKLMIFGVTLVTLLMPIVTRYT